MAHLALLASSLCCLLAGPVPAAEDTWSGGGTPDGNWQNAGNWGGTAPAAYDSLFFDTGTQLLSTNNFPAGAVFDNLTFNPGASSFILSGNSLILPSPSQDASGNIGGGALTNLSPNAQTISLPLALADGQHYLVNGGAGQLNLSGAVIRNADATAVFSTNSGPINTTGSVLANDSSGILGGWAVIGVADNSGNWAAFGWQRQRE